MSFKHVCLYDDAVVSVEDAARNTFIDKNQIGKSTRAEASLNSLQDLNSKCIVSVTHNKSFEFITNNFNCVVVIDEYDRNYMVKLNHECRQKSIGFVMGGCLGLYGFTFVDFGNHFMITDTNGQEPKRMHIESISRQQNGVVRWCEFQKFNLEVGDIFRFTQIQGMEEINGRQYTIEQILSNQYYTSFKIGDTRSFSQYKTGGIATEVKVPRHCPFKSLQESLQSPYGIDESFMPMTSYDIFDLPEQLHLTLLAVFDFYHKNQRLPRILHEEDAHELLQLAQSSKISGLKSMKDGSESFDINDLDQNSVSNTAKYAQTQILPVCIFWGGIIAQEVMKYTSKYTPLKQWLHHNFISCLPSETNLPRTIDPSSPYNDYVVLFGDEFLQKCGSSNLFMVGGNGAGIQMMRILGSMGMSRKQDSVIYVSDNEKIKRADITTSMWYKSQEIGLRRSQVLCKKAGKLTDSKAVPLKYEIGKNTEEIFNDDFWQNIDFVVSTSDSQIQNNYIDNQIIWYEKGFFVCHTKGLMSSSEVILPFKTSTYTDYSHEDQNITYNRNDRSTIVNFPFQKDHLVQWAEELFEKMFVTEVDMMRDFYDDRTAFFRDIANRRQLRLDQIEQLKKNLIAYQMKSYELCLEIVFEVFNYNFRDHIAQFLHSFPPDHYYEDGSYRSPFWSGCKRCPQVVRFDLTDPTHVRFVRIGAEIYAKIFNIPSPNDESEIISLISKVYQKLPKTQQVRQTKQISYKQTEARWAEQETIKKNLIKQLSLFPLDPLHQKPKDPTKISFEGCLDLELEFVHAAAKIRGANYRIEPPDQFEIGKRLKRNSDKVITSVSMIAGSLGIEIIKYLQDKPMESFKNTCGNLGMCFITQTEPLPPKVQKDRQFDPVMCGPVKVIPKEFSKWDKLQIKQSMLLCDFISFIKKQYKVDDVSYIAIGTNTLYSLWSNNFDKKRRMIMPLEDVIVEVMKKPIYRWKRSVDLQISGEKDGVDFSFPLFRYWF